VVVRESVMDVLKEAFHMAIAIRTIEGIAVVAKVVIEGLSH
jgi:hypothetical protein